MGTIWVVLQGLPSPKPRGHGNSSWDPGFLALGVSSNLLTFEPDLMKSLSTGRPYLRLGN